MATTKMQAPNSTFYSSKIQTEQGNYTVDASGFVTVDSRAVPALERAGFVVCDLLRAVAGEYTITSGDATANLAAIATGLTTITSATAQVVLAANNRVTTSDAAVTFTGGTLTVADGGTYDTIAGNKIRYIAFGV